MYINILLDTVLATDVNKYSLASPTANQYGGHIGQTDLFLAGTAKDCGIVFLLNRPQQSTSPYFWLVSQSRHMSAIFVGTGWCISPVADSADLVYGITTFALLQQC